MKAIKMTTSATATIIATFDFFNSTVTGDFGVDGVNVITIYTLRSIKKTIKFGESSVVQHALHSRRLHWR
jgi:hypothetical protein